MRSQPLFTAALTLLVASSATCQQVPGPIGGRPLLGLDAELVMPTRWASGSQVGARIKVLEARDASSLDPAAAAHVRIEATIRGRPRTLWQGDADDAGLVTPRFAVPDVAAGTLPVAVVIDKDGAARRLQRDVEISSEVRVLLSTDKPLYQPGQVIHIRAMALRAADLHPVTNDVLTVEVEDGRGNRVFRRRPATSRHGIAWANFTLADEVNQGEYRIAVRRGEATVAEKTVAVQRYVLPKFKIEVEGLQPFYKPGDTVRGTVHANYFFGRSIQRGRVCLTARTFDVEMHDLSTTGGTTDASGAFPFEVELPTVLAGTSLDRGDARVFLEVAITDRAAHTERKTVSFPVTTAPLRVELLPESGKLVRGVDNEIYAVAATAEGRPAGNVEIQLTGLGGAPLTGRTDDVGIATFRLVPPAGGDRYWGSGLPDGHPCLRSYGLRVQLRAQAPSGQTYEATKCLPTERSDSRGTLLLRTDKVLLEAGGSLRVTVLGGGVGDAFLDVVKGGQTVLTAVLDRGRDGRIEPYDLTLPPELAGTLELHAYGLLPDGNWARDGRIVQVQAPEGLRIAVEADRRTYRPGQDARIRFRVTDGDGHPTAAALGVIMVDESVYALQDNQPGLERVFFMLEEEILRPRYSIYGPQGLTFAAVVLGDDEQRVQQEAARVLLAAASIPERDPSVLRDPRAERRRWEQQTVPKLLRTLITHLQQHPDDLQPGDSGPSLREDLLARWVADSAVTPADLEDPLGRPVTLDEIGTFDAELTVERVALEAAHEQLWDVLQQIWRRGSRTPPAELPNLLDRLVAARAIAPASLVDPWGGRFVWRRGSRFRHPSAPRGYELASPGPDGRLGTRDDVVDAYKRIFRRHGKMQQIAEAMPRLRDRARREEERRAAARARAWRERMRERARERIGTGSMTRRRSARGRGGGGLDSLLDSASGVGSAAPSMPFAPPPARMARPSPAAEPSAQALGHRGQRATAEQPATARREGERAVARVREYFPETLLWRPEVVTDDQGRAEVALQVADSITTFRLTATANSHSGLLGSATAGVRIFQDFFVDLDLPVALTQSDRVSVPVAIYNYLNRPQHVRIAIERGNWFDLDGPEEHQLDLGPNEVTVRYFPIRARRVGEHRLAVFAYGDRMSDALRKPVTVEPNGRRQEVAFSDRLGREAEREVSIPDEAIPGSEKLLVKLYPGVVSQVVENMDALLRVPYG